MSRVLMEAAEHFQVTLRGAPTYGWRDRSIGSRADGSRKTYWLRVSCQHEEWAQGETWNGNRDAAVLVDIPKPKVIDWYDWNEGVAYQRAELMTLVDEDPCSPTPELRRTPALTEEWWRTLRRSLDWLSNQQTTRTVRSQSDVRHLLRVTFGEWIDPHVTEWATAHGDLQWSNLTLQTPYLLDWEHWGMAPAGYDAAMLYCHSLLCPVVAERVRAEFAELLDAPDGRLSLLCAVASMLWRTRNGDYPDLVIPLHRLADNLLKRKPPNRHSSP